MDVLRDAVSNISLYEVKAAVRKAQNVVMNYTEMEAKVREATNNEPWGASSTTMNEIASGTYNYQLLNEIMPMIYKRFTEKAAEEWRQIYKALQLLEFLIKNGAEQVIDDARSHLSTIKMLRQFYYIDQNGKDQGINVRNRAKELAELLSDVDRIRAERKKARTSKNKYGGVEGGGGSGGFSSGGVSGGGGNGFGRRYGGFGGDQAEFGGAGQSVYGDGGGFSSGGGGGGGSSGFHDEGSRSTSRGQDPQYEEYDEGDDVSASRRAPPPAARRTVKTTPAKPPPPKKKEPEVDLFSFDEPVSAPSGGGHGKQPSTSSAFDDFGTLQAGGDDDDFDDFQSATPLPAPNAGFAANRPPLTSSASGLSLAQPTPVSNNQRSDMSSLVGLTSPAISAHNSKINTPIMSPAATGSSGMASMQPMGVMQPMNTTGYQSPQPNYFTSVPVSANLTGSSVNKPAAAPKPAGGDAFGNIWSQASSGIKKSSTPASKTPSLQAMAKEKAQAGIWGTGSAKPSPTTSNFGGAASSSNKPGNGLEDLLG